MLHFLWTCRTILTSKESWCTFMANVWFTFVCLFVSLNLWNMVITVFSLIIFTHFKLYEFCGLLEQVLYKKNKIIKKLFSRHTITLAHTFLDVTYKEYSLLEQLTFNQNFFFAWPFTMFPMNRRLVISHQTKNPTANP